MDRGGKFKYSLSETDKQELINFYKKFEFISINQYPKWEEINNPGKKVCYYINKKLGRVKSYCVILESHKIAYVNYGPIAETTEEIIESVNLIKEYYRGINFLKLVIKLGDVDSIGLQVLNHFKGEYLIEKKPYNWSTLRIELNEDIDTIFKKFRSNHKQSIKKAIKQNVDVRPIPNLDEVRELANIFDKMYSNRKLIKSFDSTYQVFSKIFSFFNEKNTGWVLGVYDGKKLIGGLILPIQGKTVYYQYGMTSVDFRHIPILHLGLYEAIKRAKEKGYAFFDFGGYMPDIEKTDQIYHINRFKKWFGGEILFYPKNMHFILSPLRYSVYSRLKELYTLIFR